MARPTLLVAEPEPPQAVSVRKLVLETAKFNVLTAHHNREVMELFHRFPNIDGIVLVTEGCLDCEWLAEEIKKSTTKIPVIFLSPRLGAGSDFADHTLSSYEPEKLLKLARSLFGDPLEMDIEAGGSAQADPERPSRSK